MAPEPTDRERNLQTLARAHRVYLTSGTIFRPTAELWIDKLTDEMLRTEALLELDAGVMEVKRDQTRASSTPGHIEEQAKRRRRTDNKRKSNKRAEGAAASGREPSTEGRPIRVKDGRTKAQTMSPVFDPAS